MAKRSQKARSDIVIKAKTTSFRILEIGQTGIKAEFTSKGTVAGRYRGTHWDTVEMQMTDRGELLVGTGAGTGEAPNTKGVAKLKGEGTLTTSSQRLASMTGNGWTCEVDNYVVKDTAIVAVRFR